MSSFECTVFKHFELFLCSCSAYDSLKLFLGTTCSKKHAVLRLSYQMYNLYFISYIIFNQLLIAVCHKKLVLVVPMFSDGISIPAVVAVLHLAMVVARVTETTMPQRQNVYPCALMPKLNLSLEPQHQL